MDRPEHNSRIADAARAAVARRAAMGGCFDWTDERIAKLRVLWADATLSAGVIARTLGTTKNSVVGKTHRLGLDRRPSPITGERLTAGRRAPKKIEHKIGGMREMKAARAVSAVRRPVVAPTRPVEIPSPRYVGAIGHCQFPTSNGRPWTFCDDPSLPGQPYCSTHHAVCFIAPGKTPGAPVDLFVRHSDRKAA